MRARSRRRHRRCKYRARARRRSDDPRGRLLRFRIARSKGCRTSSAREAELSSEEPLEDRLVQAIAAIAATTVRGKKLRVGIGDDAAVWKPSRAAESVITTDALVENVHFLREGMSAADIG